MQRGNIGLEKYLLPVYIKTFILGDCMTGNFISIFCMRTGIYLLLCTRETMRFSVIIMQFIPDGDTTTYEAVFVGTA